MKVHFHVAKQKQFQFMQEKPVSYNNKNEMEWDRWMDHRGQYW